MIPNSKTFIITIPSHRQRFEATMSHLNGQGIDPIVFVGLDHKVSGLETRWEFQHLKNDDPPNLMAKSVNLHFSHYMLWKVCSYQPQDAFVILEDDVRLDPEWKQHLSDTMMSIPESWDVLFIGSCCTADKDTKVQVADRLWKIQYANCTHAYAVRKKAIPILLDVMQRIDAKLDISLSAKALPLLNCFAILPRLAHQEGTHLHP